MQIIKGKYNSANIMIDDIDAETRKQIQGFCNNPSFQGSYIAIMPDCHAGAGSCIGFTMQMKDRIVPDVVGVDIGCGMLSRKYAIKDISPEALDNFVRENIPSGFSVNSRAANTDMDFYKDTVKRIGIDSDRVDKSLGTLGGGNHFLELGLDENGDSWLTVHSGSRNFGLQIAKYHGKKAKELCNKWGADTQGIPFLVVDSPEGRAYFNDAIIGAKYAALNRRLMLNKIERYFLKVDAIEEIESVHNFIDESGMIRKGATMANDGQMVIIPFNMRDGLAICKGKGSKKYNYSAPHGAGRILSRSKAKALLDVDYFKEDMKQSGVYTTTANASTLDESPDAYKDKDMIIENIKETVDIISFVKPIWNFKAGNE